MIDLVKARALCAAATPGPWTMWESEDQNLGPSVQGVMPSPAHPPLLHIVVDLHAEEGDAGYWPVIMTQDDAAFIAAARTGWPEALDNYETALKIIEEYKVSNIQIEIRANRDSADLKAEVERLQKRYDVQADGWKAANERLTQVMAENARLKAEVERLRGERSNSPHADHWTPIEKLEAENARLRLAIAGLHDAIKHGDDNHQNWLKAAIDDHFRAALAAPQTGGDP